MGIFNLRSVAINQVAMYPTKKMVQLFLFIVLFYSVIVLFFYLFQSKFLFFPQPITSNPYLTENIEEVAVISSDGNRLHGWLYHKKQDSPQKLIIYFGGNAEEVSHMIPMVSMFKDWAMLLINYPGYGFSEGKPGQESFFNAALAIYDFAVSRDDIDSENVVLLGRSIGSGPAVFLAHERNVRSVILISPFESIRAVAQSKMPFLPVGLILKHPFPSKKFADTVDAPLLAFYGSADSIIPQRHTKRLAESWKGPVRLIELASFGHNDVFESQQMWEEIIGFLNR